jgi:hypothetical protein
MTESLVGGALGVPLSIRATAVVASAVIKAARQLLIDLEQGRRIDAAVLRNAMEAAFGASDTTGAWIWKTAYDACEAATVLFPRRYGVAMRAKAASPAAMSPMLMRIVSLLPTQTRRSEESQSLQQFSTPIGLAFVASIAAGITPADVVLERTVGWHWPTCHPCRNGRRFPYPQRVCRQQSGYSRAALSRSLHDAV